MESQFDGACASAPCLCSINTRHHITAHVLMFPFHVACAPQTQALSAAGARVRRLESQLEAAQQRATAAQQRVVTLEKRLTQV